MWAHVLTSIRLVLVLPVGYLLAGQEPGSLLFLLVVVAIGTDLLDGPVARATGTASSAGQRFDHLTDLIFVSSTLMVAGVKGLITPLLAPLVMLAFLQYWLDSRILHRMKSLRMSQLGRWNGVFYFVPVLLLSLAFVPFLSAMSAALSFLAALVAWLLVVSTLASMVDRALAKPTGQEDSLSR